MGRNFKKLEYTFDTVLRALERKSQLSESEIKKDARLVELLKESKDTVRDYILSVFAEQLSEADKKTLEYAVTEGDDMVAGGDTKALSDNEDEIDQESILAEEGDDGEETVDELVSKILSIVDAEEAKDLIDGAAPEDDMDADDDAVDMDDMDMGSDDEAEFESTDNEDTFVSGDDIGDDKVLESGVDFDEIFKDDEPSDDDFDPEDTDDDLEDDDIESDDEDGDDIDLDTDSDEEFEPKDDDFGSDYDEEESDEEFDPEKDVLDDEDYE